MSEPLTADQQRYLLNLARQSIARFLEARDQPVVSIEDARFLEKRGVFVTLKVDDELRGCVGYPLPHKPLAEAVAEMAVAAAHQDFRFPPLKPEELERTKIEISVLGLPQPIDRPDQIEVGRHGIIVSKGFHKGLLLPQVPIEHHWDRETYLEHGCLKAGLGPDEWKKGAKIEIFSAQVFSE